MVAGDLPKLLNVLDVVQDVVSREPWARSSQKLVNQVGILKPSCRGGTRTTELTRSFAAHRQRRSQHASSEGDVAELAAVEAPNVRHTSSDGRRTGDDLCVDHRAFVGELRATAGDDGDEREHQGESEPSSCRTD